MKYIPVDLETPDCCVECILYRTTQYRDVGQCVAMPDVDLKSRYSGRNEGCPFDKAKEFDE